MASLELREKKLGRAPGSTGLVPASTTHTRCRPLAADQLVTWPAEETRWLVLAG
jgi:hypothetical protein